MKKLLFLVFFLGCFSFLTAQELKQHDCSTDQLHLKLLKEGSDYKKKFDSNSILWKKYATEKKTRSNNSSKNAVDDPIPLTVAFHNMVSNESSGVVDYDGVVNNLNGFFTTQIGVEFCRALTDTKGNTYDGTLINHSSPVITTNLYRTNIEQIKSLVVESGSQGSTTSPKKFPSDKYINIYIVDNIDGDTAGFAFLPSAHGEKFDGIYIERSFLLNSNPNDIKVLVHEMGHYLGLFHVFGICDPDVIGTVSGCSCDDANPYFNGDMVADTPPSMLNLGVCDTTMDSCIDAAGPDDKENYMDYSLESCKNHFTIGQKDRMLFMLDPIWGARSSLLNNRTCVHCEGLNLCEFSILPPSEIVDSKVQIGTTLTFNQDVQNCETLSTYNYQWTLLNLDTGVIETTASGNNFSCIPSVIGNYKLTLIASLDSSSSCSEIIDYNFQVLPISEIISPYDCTTNWTDWENVSYTGGWALNPGGNTTDYVYTSTNRQNPGNLNNFDVIPSYNFGDANFPNAVTPPTIANVYRVGKVINSSNTLDDGSASFTKVKFRPTPGNCKYRIYYLGMFDGNVSVATDPKFGFTCQMKYNSPVYSPIVEQNVGKSEWDNRFEPNGITPLYGLNDFSLDYSVSELHPQSYNGINYSAMNDWKYKDIDFSEFAKLNENGATNFEVTLTFYSRSNDQAVAKKHCYAYFAVECLGGGVPQNIVWEPKNIENPCEFPVNSSCYLLELPRPNYTLPTLSWYGDVRYGFANVSSVRTSTDDITYTSTAITVIQDPEDFKYRLKLCTTQSGSQMYKYFEITYKTINQTFVKKIRVSNQFYHDDPPCANPPIVDGLPVYGGVIASSAPKYYIVCEEKEAPYNYPILTYEDPCFEDVVGYKWFCNGIEIEGATSDSLDLNLFPGTISGNPIIESKCKIVFERKALYKDPYCGNIVRYVSQPYVVYNKVGNQIQMKRRVDDFCALGDFNMAIDDLYVFRCQEEEDYSNYELDLTTLSSLDNSVRLQLYKDIEGEIPLGTFQDIPFYNMDYHHNNIVFNFHNYNASNPFVPIFMPGNHTVYLSVTYNFYGCTKTFQIPITFSVSPTAVRGSLLVKNDCALDDVIADPDFLGFTNSTYEWLISVDGGNNYVTIPGQTSADLPNYHHFVSYPRPVGSPTVWVKRKSKGFPTCPGDLITEPVQLPQALFKFIPTFDIPETYCFQDNANTFLPLSSTNQIPISGTWIPAFDPNNINPSGYTFIPNPNQCAIDIRRTVKIITMTQIQNINLCNSLTATTQTVPRIDFSAPSGQGTVTYSWVRNSPSTLSGTGLPMSGTTAFIPQFTAKNVSSLRVITFTVTPSVNGCMGRPMIFRINQNPVSTITASNVSVCNNESATISFSSTNATAYSWTIDPLTPVNIAYSSVNPNIQTNFSNLTSFNINPSIPLSAPQNTAYIFNIIITPFSNGCIGTPKTITVTIKPTPIVRLTTIEVVNGVSTYVDIPNNSIEVCSNGYVPRIYPKSNPDGGTFYWEVLGNNNINMSSTNGSAFNYFSSFTAFTNDTDYPQTNTIRVNSILKGCVSDNVFYTITVLPRAKMTPPSNYTFCVGETVSIPFSSIAPSETLSYDVTSSGTYNGIPDTISGISSLNFTTSNTTTTPAVRTVTVTPVRNGCKGKPETFTVVVMPNVDFNISSSSSPLNNMCSGTQMTITNSSNLISTLYPSNVLTYTYTYTASQNVSIAGINFNNNGVLQFTGNNNSGSNGTVDFTFTSTYSNSNYPNFNCAGPTKTIKVYIYPKINLTFPPQNAIVPPDLNNPNVPGDIANVTVCKTNVPSSFPEYKFLPNPLPSQGAVKYTWACISNFAATNLTMNNSGLPANTPASYTIPAFTITNNTSSPLTVTFVITANFTTSSWLPCVVTKTINYTVIPPPTLVANPDEANVVNPNGSIISLTNSSNTIFANDTYNGISLNASQVNLTETSPPIAGISLNPLTGQISVASTVANGAYTMTYLICDKICNTTCSQPATVTINVTRTAVLVANRDGDLICYNSLTGFHSTYSILSNDTNNGLPVNSSDVQIVLLNTGPTAITVNPDGTFNVSPGFYHDYDCLNWCTSVPYKICDINNPTICSNISVLKFELNFGNRINTIEDYISVSSTSSNGTIPNFNVTHNDLEVDNCDGEFHNSPSDYSSSQLNLSGKTLSQITTIQDPHFSILPSGEVVINDISTMQPGTVYTNKYRIVDNFYSFHWSEATVSVMLDNTNNKAAVKDNTDSVIQIKPNPTKGIFYINFGSQLKQETAINVYNVIGQKVYETKVNGVTESQIDLSNYPSGNYLIKISDGEQITSKTIIKE